MPTPTGERQHTYNTLMGDNQPMTEYETLQNAKEDWQNTDSPIHTYRKAEVVVNITKEPQRNRKQNEDTKYRLVRYFKNHRDNWNVSVDEDRASLSTVLDR